MKKTYTSIFSGFFILGILGLIYFTMMPQWISKDETSLTEFSTQRALDKVKIIAAKPHFIGSENHSVVAGYLEKELQELGLATKIEEGTTLSDWGNLVKSKNIMTRIKGTSDNSKALLLLSHYDSAPHSFSHGASDNAAGVATILESLRAFLHNKTPHKNDIIILFSDAEELGLNGAAHFVTQSEWAKEVGLVLNFEARGTAGPSYMLMEVNAGNTKMVNAFAKASPKFPVSNSLMYSIYKMLPNDTDLSVFREQKQIQGFNFAFIDDHFNYHTVQDDLEHLSPKSLAHQGSYLMPLLNYFSNADISDFSSSEDQIYFNTPFFFFHYSFGWIFPMVIIAFVLFIFLVFLGIAKRILILKLIGKGFISLFSALIIAGLAAFLGWKLLLIAYPHYQDILHGFTYNGHSYIAAFVFLSLAIGFILFAKIKTEILTINYSVAPLFLWLLLNLGIALLLPGAGFFIIPVYFGLIVFAYYIITQKTNNTLNLILSIPALCIFTPFIVMLPIGLGLKILIGSAVLTILVFGLLLPIFGSFAKKRIWSILMFLISIGFFINAHLHSDYVSGKAKPNSLLYVYDADKDRAVWTTYDINLDEWTKIYLTNSPKNAKALADIPLFSKYNSGFTYTSEALVRALPESTIEFLTDSIIGTQRYLKIRISPNRKVNRYDVFANEKLLFHNLKANGAKPLEQKNSLYLRKGKKLISYYLVNNEPLELQFSIAKNAVLDMELLESSFDLMNNPLFAMKKRPDWMMPTSFVLTDAVVIRKKIRPTPRQIVPIPVKQYFSLPKKTGNDTIPDADENEFNTP